MSIILDNMGGNSTSADENLSRYIVEAPKLSNLSSDTVKERDYIEVDIDNYDPELVYEANIDLVTKIRYKSGNTFKVYFGNVDVDTDIEFYIRAKKLGWVYSEWSNAISVTVTDNPEEVDDAIINDDFVTYEDSSDSCEVTNDKVTMTTDNAWYKEVITAQGVDENDWSSYQTIADIELEKMDILDDTNKDTLVVSNSKIEDVSRCYIASEEYPNGKEISIDSVVDNSISIVNKVDPFNDNSGLLCWQFDGDFTDLGGNYNSDEATADYEWSSDTSLEGKTSIILKTDDDTTDEFIVPNDCGINDSDIHTLTYRCKVLAGEPMQVISLCPTVANDNRWYLRVIIDSDNSTGYLQLWHPNHTINSNTLDLLYSSDGQWHTIWFVVDRDNNKITFGVDDKNLGTFDINVTLDNKSDFAFFRDAWLETDKMWLQQVRIFKRPLTESEIGYILNEKITKYEADISSNNLGTDLVMLVDPFNNGNGIAAFPFDGNSTDLSGNYNGVWKDGDGNEVEMSFIDDGRFGKAIDRYNVSDICYMDTDIKEDIEGKIPLSFSIWLRLEEIDTERRFLFGTGTWGGFLNHYTIAAYIDKDDNHLYIVFSNGTDYEELDTGFDMNNIKGYSKFHHIVITTNMEDTVKLYIDGKLVNTISQSIAPDHFDHSLYLAGFNESSDNYGVLGYIDQFRVFKEELDDDKVYKIFKEQTGYPTSAYFIEENVTIKTALTKDLEPNDPDDFNEEILESWTINTVSNIKENIYKKVNDYSGNRFQRKVIGDKNANITYLKSNMWKDS